MQGSGTLVSWDAATSTGAAGTGDACPRSTATSLPPPAGLASVPLLPRHSCPARCVQARESLDRSVCWPASWLAKELPDARLISVEYAAPASGWEVSARLPYCSRVGSAEL